MAAKHAAPLMLLRLGSVLTLIVSTADAARAAFRGNNDRAIPACVSELLGAPRVRAFRDVRESEAAALMDAVTDSSTGSGSSPVNLSDKLVVTSNNIVRRVAFRDAGQVSKAVLEEAQKLSSWRITSRGWGGSTRSVARGRGWTGASVTSTRSTSESSMTILIITSGVGSPTPRRRTWLTSSSDCLAAVARSKPS
ncbi:hypothetical protein PR202_ga31633 [Eleusine coracana subsp. coracana]|uniref:Uncharacterized protein n=1 Tax=Eleusine coracana subsp. coracana TaxID=191504 RepID=A0AAV5DS76_ELECO|nr:hypothetical protein PR202_ga31633 [Eleusine coracana subsp. coracana]